MIVFVEIIVDMLLMNTIIAHYVFSLFTNVLNGVIMFIQKETENNLQIHV